MQRIKATIPTRPACEACKASAQEVLCPVGDGAQRTCYLCAHFLTEHADDVAEHGIMGVYDRARAICGHTKAEIYPADVLFERRTAPEPPALRALRLEVEARSAGVTCGAGVTRAGVSLSG